MVRKLVEHLYDDLDGSAIDHSAGRTVTFALEGVSYEIDLSHAHIDDLRGALALYIGAGRKVPAGVEAQDTPRRQRGDERLSAIRAWANGHGYSVAPKGRVPRHVVQAYDAAH